MASAQTDQPPQFPTPNDLITFQFDDVPRLLRREIDAMLVEHNLGRTHWRLLAYAMREEGQTQSALAAKLELERAPVGQAIDRLEERGFLKRTRLDGDRRAWRIVTTKDARELLPQLRGRVDAIYARMFEGFSEEEKSDLSAKLSRLIINLQG